VKDTKIILEDRILFCADIIDTIETKGFKLIMETFAQMAEREKDKLLHTPAENTMEIQRLQFVYRFLTELFPNFISNIKQEGPELVARAASEGFLGVTDAQSPVNGTHPESAVGG